MANYNTSKYRGIYYNSPSEGVTRFDADRNAISEKYRHFQYKS